MFFIPRYTAFPPVNAGELDKIRIKGVPVPNVKGLYEVTVSTYGTSYERAVRLVTLY